MMLLEDPLMEIGKKHGLNEKQIGVLEREFHKQFLKDAQSFGELLEVLE